MLDPKIQEELQKTQDFADEIQIMPYAQVKRNLDDLAAKTAKEAAEKMVEQFERLG